MSRMPVGAYVPGSSPLHAIDPLMKLLGFLALIAAVILTDSPVGYGLLALFIGGMVVLSGVSPRLLLASLKRTGVFFVVIFLMNALFYGGDAPFWQWWILRPSPAGIVQGLHVALRLSALVCAAAVLTAVTSPMAITNALMRLLSPLGRIGVRVDVLTLIISVAIRFVPVLSEEVDTIIKAQTARGARFGSRRLHERALSMLPLIIPVFLSAFKRADELAMAMEARGYRIDKRRPLRPSPPLCVRDLLAPATTLALLAFEILL